MAFTSTLTDFVSPNISVLEENGVPVEFRCPLPTSRSALKPSKRKVNQFASREIIISFGYEFTVPDPREDIDEVLVQDVPDLEYGYLFLVAQSTGLLKCQSNNDVISLWADNVGNKTNKQGPYLISLSTGPSDDVDYKSVGTCQKLNARDGHICVPIVGAMTAGFVGNEADSDAVRNYLYSHIKREIDSSELRVHGISGVTFIGNTSDDSTAAGSQTDASDKKVVQQRSVDNRFTIVATSLAVGCLIVLFFAALAIRRRRRRLQDADSLPATHSRIQSDLEERRCIVSTGSADDSDGAIVSNTAKGNQEDPTVAQSGTQADVDTPPLALHLSASSATDTAKQLSTTSSVVTAPTTNVNQQTQQPRSLLILATNELYNPESEVMSVVSDVAVSGDAYCAPRADIGRNVALESNLVSRETPDSMPPKPPTSSKPPVGPSSKTIKINRKKKKKKKQRLIRTNSRENITEMETITEEKDTENDEKSSDCSEYSCYSTDDEGSQTGSREASPGRSRDPSPSSLRSRESGSGADHNYRKMSSSSADDSLQALLSNESSSSLDPDAEVPTSQFTQSNDPDSSRKDESCVPTWV